MDEKLILFLAAIGLGAWYFARPQSNAVSAGFDWGEYFPSDNDAGLYPDNGNETNNGFDFYPWEFNGYDSNQYGGSMYPVITAPANILAFLSMIIHAEGTANGGRDPYSTVYSYVFENSEFSDHPANLGWRGVRLPDQYCRGAGLSPGCVSTAAGAYQIIKPTWNALNMPDFSPMSQDAAAIKLLQQSGAYPLILSGNIQGAINKASKTWASLPGSTSGQPQVAINNLLSVYENAGGNFA